MEVSNKLSEKALIDYKIVCKAINGEKKAYDELFKKYKNSVYFMLLRIVKDESDTEDLLLEAFAKAFINLKHYSPQFAFSTWLFKIASNNAIDFIRRKRLQTTSLDAEYANADDYSYINSIAADIRTPDEEAIRQQRALFIREKVALLKDNYRVLIELRYFEELSYEEIAESLSLPLGTVKAKLFRARELLINMLQHSESI